MSGTEGEEKSDYFILDERRKARLQLKHDGKRNIDSEKKTKEKLKENQDSGATGVPVEDKKEEYSVQV